MACVRCAAILLGCLLLPVPAPAQQPPKRDPNAVQLLQQAFVALEGLQKNSVSDVRVEGTLSSPSAPDQIIGTFVAKARGTDLSVETVRNGEQMAFRSLNGLGSIRAKGKIKPLPPYNTHGLSLDILPLFARWTEFLQANASVHLVGQVNVDGAACHLVRVESEDTADPLYKNDHRKTDVFIDASTGLIAAIRYQATRGRFNTDQVSIENRFSEYRPFGTLLVPTKVKRYIMERAMVVIHVQAVQFNNGFTDAEFWNEGRP